MPVRGRMTDAKRRQGSHLLHHPEVTMTTGPTDTPDPEATEELLDSMAQQVAQ